MDYGLSPTYLAFQSEVRAFLKQRLTPELREAGARMTSVFIDKQWSIAWQKILHEKGWVAPDWPVEHGGPGWSDTQRAIFAAECAAASAPSLAPQGLKMVGPVLMRYGTPEQKAHYLPRLLSGEDFWCQGYSEPGAGSDLASLRMAAVPDGSDYVLNGSKIWTTHAHFANRIFCLVRTSTQGKPQEGITFLLIDMATPGITVRPILSLSGDHDLNEVFFDDVRVPQANRVGAENEGWTVAKYLLEFERGGSMSPGLKATLARAREQAAAEGLLADPAFRRRLLEAEANLSAIEATEQRILSALTGGKNPGPLSSLLKIQATEAMQKIDELGIEAAGPYGTVEQTAARQPLSQLPYVGPEHSLTAMPRYFNNRAASIYGGSNEIQRNLIAKMVLGL
ncbi:acyl-CoA dehydrogenase [Sandaracinobacter neustonicus]|uniref:Acyl-CoA dehydrogenase n=1 Tax=Sandaracinobacter neustonicus TaxID=1715348 RepID=A0A501XG04_9SPHN|nr:acyl-CoA dehydrogenase family protein [Sandaracinobacter neustonicus]TPE59558.1 acyl-CoA dehydrogenase [Sandaracinobacter neustonicus]